MTKVSCVPLGKIVVSSAMAKAVFDRAAAKDDDEKNGTSQGKVPRRVFKSHVYGISGIKAHKFAVTNEAK